MKPALLQLLWNKCMRASQIPANHWHTGGAGCPEPPPPVSQPNQPPPPPPPSPLPLPPAAPSTGCSSPIGAERSPGAAMGGAGGAMPPTLAVWRPGKTSQSSLALMSCALRRGPSIHVEGR